MASDGSGIQARRNRLKKLDTYGLVHRFWFLRYKALLSNPLDTLSSVLKCWKCRIILHFFASELVYWPSTGMSFSALKLNLHLVFSQFFSVKKAWSKKFNDSLLKSIPVILIFSRSLSDSFFNLSHQTLLWIQYFLELWKNVSKMLSLVLKTKSVILHTFNRFVCT